MDETTYAGLDDSSAVYAGVDTMSFADPLASPTLDHSVVHDAMNAILDTPLSAESAWDDSHAQHLSMHSALNIPNPLPVTIVQPPPHIDMNGCNTSTTYMDTPSSNDDSSCGGDSGSCGGGSDD